VFGVKPAPVTATVLLLPPEVAVICALEVVFVVVVVLVLLVVVAVVTVNVALAVCVLSDAVTV
jgi:hypothetical protein